MGTAGELLGREHELAFLLAELGRVRDGGRAVALGLKGEAGVGKTALLQELSLRSGVRSFWVAGHEHDQDTPMGAVAHLLRSLPRSAWTGLPPGVQETLDAVLGRGAISSRRLLVEALVAVSSSLAATEPVLFVVDDAHWIDLPSQKVLAEVVPRIAGDAVGLLLACRPVPCRLAEAARMVDLHGLSSEAAGELGRRLGLAGPVADDLASRTGGNPLATITVARSLSAEQRRGQVGLPRTLEIGPRLVDSYGPVLAALPTPTRAALTVLAVADGLDDVTVERSLVAAGHRVADLAPAHDEGLIDGLAFVHPLVRSAVLGAAPAPDRIAAHRAVAGAVEPEADPERWAWHVSEGAAADRTTVAEAFSAAADAAYAKGSRIAAARYHEQAAMLTADPATRFARAFTAAMLLICYGETGAGRSALEVAIAAAPSLDEQLLASAMRPLTGVASARECSAELMATAAAHAEDAPIAAQFHLVCAAQLAAMDGDFERLGRAAEQLALIVERAGGPSGPIAALLSEMKRSMIDGEHDLVVVPAMAQMALAIEDHSVLPEHVGLAGDTTGGFAYGAATLLANERWDEAISTLERVFTHNAVTGWHGAFADVAVWLIEAYWRAGRWNDAFLAATATLEIYDDGRSRDRATLLLATTAKVQAGLGRLGEFEAIDRTLAADMGRLDFMMPRMTLAHAHALVALAGEDWTKAYEALRPVDEWAGERLHPGWMWWEADLLEAMIGARVAGVGARIARFETQVQEFPVVHAQAMRCVGLHASDERISLRSLQESVDALAASPARFEHARSLLALGTRQLRAKAVAARRSLEAAAGHFEALGASQWHERVVRQLDPGTRRKRPLTRLSDRELRVALLVADGLSNKKIAAELGVSPKTVEFHLSNVFRKFEVASRTELVRELARR